MTRASIRPTSPHGYWIRPDGSLMAMEAPQDHGAWLIRNQVFPDHNFALAIDATEHAVAAGWIGITISPLHGNSVGLHVRIGAVEREAAKTLRQVLREDGLDQREVYCARGRGLGRDLATLVYTTSCDSARFPDRADEVAHRRAAIEDLLSGLAEMRQLAVVLTAEGGPRQDVDAVVVHLEAVQELARSGYAALPVKLPQERNVLQVTAMVTACLAKITPVAAHLATRTKELGPLFLGPSAPTVILEPGLLPPAATNFPTLEEELVALHMTSRVLVRAQAAVGLHGLRQRHPAFNAVHQEVTAIAHWAGHLRHNLERMRAAMIHPDATGETIGDAARFFLDHECGRTFHVIAERSIPDLLTVKLPALRRELAAAAEDVPTP